MYKTLLALGMHDLIWWLFLYQETEVTVTDQLCVVEVVAEKTGMLAVLPAGGWPKALA